MVHEGEVMRMSFVRMPGTPKRRLPKVEAALYCDLTVNRFVLLCPVRPFEMPAGKPIYDIRELDRWIESGKIVHDLTHEDATGTGTPEFAIREIAG